MDPQQLEIDFLILADRAEAVAGKLYMLGGGWNRNRVRDFSQPVAFSLALGVIVPWNETNEEHSLTIFVEDEDGRRIQPEIHAAVNVGRPPDAVKGQSFRTILAVNGAWKLSGPGTYRAVATLGETQPKRSTFYVVSATEGIGRPGLQSGAG